ncbi:MAG: YDG domain-containing protein [Sedimentibacter sp.]|uniref:YDG domain-containing protein n=1 Tax=Sedimentibacter sp. TaxID=1960295 RepID=UPI0031596349
MKKSMIKSVFLAIAFIFVLTQSVLASESGSFSDMPNDWSTIAIENAISNGLLSGDNGKIMPGENLTRAQMAAIIVRAFGTNEKTSLASFSDISDKDWYYESMAKAVQMKAFVGNGDKLYPNSNITREEAFVVLARAFKLSGSNESFLDSFKDKSIVSDWAKDCVSSLAAEGYISGSEGMINPKKNITRAEFAQLMDNILQNYIVKSGAYTDDFNGNVMINRPDVILKNITINGDLVIGDGVGDGDVTLDGVIVTGKVLIRGGGINSIKIVGDSSIRNIVIARVDGQVRVYSGDGTEIGQLIADGYDDVIIDGKIGNVTVTAPNVTVTAVNADVRTALIEGENSNIIFASGSSADKVIINAANTTVKVEGSVAKILANGTGAVIEGKGNVGSVEANADEIDITTPNTKVTASKGTTGITAGGVEISSGSSATTNTNGTGIITNKGSSAKQLTISDPTLNKSKTYDGSTTADVTAGTLVGVNDGDVVTVNASASYDTSLTGTGKTITVVYTLGGKDASKYVKPSDYSVNDGEITAKQLTVSAASLIKTKTYDGSTSASVSAGTLSGVVGDDVVTITAVANYNTSSVGTGKTIVVEYTLDGADINNYIKPIDYSVIGGEIIAKQLTISDPALNATKTYDGSTSAAVSAGTLSGVVAVDDVTVSSVAEYDTSMAGTNKTITVVYTLGGADKNNYIKPADYSITDGEITVKQLTVTAPSLTKTKTYDGSKTAAVTAGTLDGVAAGDDVTVSAVAEYDTSSAGTNKTITVVYTLSGTDRNNYIKPADYSVTDGEITAKQLTVTAPSLTKTKTYDGNTTAAVAAGTLSGVAAGDDVTVSAVAEYDASSAGTNKTITVVYSLLGEDAGKYSKPSDYIVTDGEITAKQLTVTAPSLTTTKAYDGSTTAAVTAGTMSGVVDGDEVTINAAADYDTSTTGSDKTITVVYTLGGADKDNYNKPSNYSAVNGEITAIQLTATAPSLTKTKTYDGNTTAAVTAGTLNGVIAGDDVTVSADADYDASATGTNKTITVVYTLGGTDKDNYIKPVDYFAADAEITAKQLTVTAPLLTTTKAYDGSTTAAVTAGTLNGVIVGDNVTVSATASYDTSEKGTNKTITVVYTLGGADAGKYIKPADYSVTVGEITAKQLTVTAPSLATTKTYDKSTTAAVTAGTLSGVVDGDDVTVSASASYSTSFAGTNKTITVVYTIGGEDAGKYIKPADYSVTVGEITAKQLTVTAPSLTKTKTYDKSTTAAVSSGTLSGIVDGDDVTVSAVADYATSSAGTNKTITVVYTLGGTDKGNYIKPANYTAADGEITAIQLTVTTPSLTTTKTYDGNTTAAVTAGTLSGVVDGDDVTISAAADYDTSAAGTNKTITVVYILGGADKNNYIKPANFMVTNGEITVPNLDQPKPTGLAGVAPSSSSNNDGKITGVDNTMEYKLSSDENWITVTGAEINNLSAGTYNVRYAARTGYNPGTIANVTVPAYVESLTSKVITKFDYSTIYASQAQLTSKVITTSDFSSNNKYFTVMDNQGHVIPVDLWWNIPQNEYATTPASSVGSGVESIIQQWFYDNFGLDGFSIRTLSANSFDGSHFVISTFATGADATIYVDGPDWAYFFDNQFAHGTSDDSSANASFTISDGVDTATIYLEYEYYDINDLVDDINYQINSSSVNATATSVGTDRFKITGNGLTISGTNKTDFFDVFVTE